jgi:secreted Zn-dependent insulinase-like peptidase
MTGNKSIAIAVDCSALQCSLFVKLVADALNELAYPAELAGLSYAIHNTQARGKGLRLKSAEVTCTCPGLS